MLNFVTVIVIVMVSQLKIVVLIDLFSEMHVENARIVVELEITDVVISITVVVMMKTAVVFSKQ